jgi:hypothetical protein
LNEFYAALRFPDRLEDVSKFKSADGGVVEERGEDKIGARGDDNDAVFRLVELAGEDIS